MTHWMYALIQTAVSMLKESAPQIVLFSATFPDRVKTFASKFAANANKIELKKEELSVEGIKQFYMDCKDEEAKYDILVQIYSLLTVGQSIIFTKVLYSKIEITLPLLHLHILSSIVVPRTASRNE